MLLNTEINFEESDFIGETTLNVIAKADKFNTWMYSTIRPHCRGKVLEIGSGIGNISAFFMEEHFEIMLTDIRPHYCKKLNETFDGNPCFLGTSVMDLTDPNFDIEFSEHLGQYDTVFALNVVEHIKEDTLALANCYKLLKEEGQLIILVPSYQLLYNTFDEQLGHYRRYTKKSLRDLFVQNDFIIVHEQYFNFIGIFGWYVTGGLFKKSSIPGNQMKLYNSLVPVFKRIDKLIFNRVGLSTIIVGRK